MERLQKVLARAGVASRRAAERLIVEGRVSVNGTTVTRLGTRIDPQRDSVKVDGRRIPRPSSSHSYFMLNKPRGYLTALSDPLDRPTVRQLLPHRGARVYPVGRLDFNTEGLLLLTDDGELARDLMHPGRGVPKTYLAKVRGEPSEEALRRLSRGIALDGRRTLPADLRVVRRGGNAWVEVTIVEGRKHQIRKMLEAVGHPVLKLRRTHFAGLSLGDLPRGRVRPLKSRELDRLKRAAQGDSPRRGHRP